MGARKMVATGLALVLAGQSGAALAGPANLGVKAAMIYNIMRFMALPDAKPRIRLCLRRSDELAAELGALSGEPVGSGQLEVWSFGSVAEMPRSCDILYLGNAGAVPLARGQISIGDGTRFVDDGGTVGLLSFGGQLRFAINSRVASNGGVRVSSQLMRLAARVVN